MVETIAARFTSETVDETKVLIAFVKALAGGELPSPEPSGRDAGACRLTRGLARETARRAECKNAKKKAARRKDVRQKNSVKRDEAL